MASVQSTIRAEVKRGEFPVPKGAEVFPAYAIASAKGLIPEMENAARWTLNHPMTLETLGEGLRLFEGWALRDLAGFRKRCRDSFIVCLDSFLETQTPNRARPKWLNQFLTRTQNDLRLQKFTRPLDIPSRIRREYVAALQNHGACEFCLVVYTKDSSTFCSGLENKLAQARNKVPHSLYFSSTVD
jgi:hypothetical protein